MGTGQSRTWIKCILDRYEEPLLRYALRFTRDSEKARDVVQETFLRLCKERLQNDMADHLAAWLFTVCKNIAIDGCRKEQRMTTVSSENLQHPLVSGAEPGSLAEQQEEAGRLIEHLNQLPETEREVIRLKFEQGLTYREISQVTNHSVSYVGVLLHQGIKKLRQQYAPELAETTTRPQIPVPTKPGH